LTALKFYVEYGLGIALVPKILVDPETKGTTVRIIRGSLIHMTFGILCKESAYPFQMATQKLYHYLKKELISHSE
jgi:DNA-binding transcriptional LysR family regulator